MQSYCKWRRGVCCYPIFQAGACATQGGNSVQAPSCLESAHPCASQPTKYRLYHAPKCWPLHQLCLKIISVLDVARIIDRTLVGSVPNPIFACSRLPAARLTSLTE